MGGKPNQVSFLGSQGQLIEQWIYLDTQGVRYVNLLHSPGESKPRVVAFYTLPASESEGRPRPITMITATRLLPRLPGFFERMLARSPEYPANGLTTPTSIFRSSRLEPGQF